jgi:ankyrin repeat protein
MNNVCLFSVRLMALLLLIGVHTADCDMTPMNYRASPSGGGVSPKSAHTAIRLESQEVTIRLKQFSYTVEAVFQLNNTGKTTTEWIGFPKRPMGRRPGLHGRILDFIQFEGTVNGHPIPFTEERAFVEGVKNSARGPRDRTPKYTSWMTGQATFLGHTRTTIRVKYRAHYENMGFRDRRAVYIFGTGRHWKDTIGTAVFIIDSTELGGTGRIRVSLDAFPLQRRLARNVEIFELKDFEPSPGAALTCSSSNESFGEDRRSNSDRLAHAALNGKVETLKALLKKRVDVNNMSHYGKTPLMNAADSGNVPIAKLLIARGADVNAKNKHGETALKSAMSSARYGRGQLEVARLLVEHGAEPTTLAVAAFVGDMEAVQRLLPTGTNAKTKDTGDGPSPLTAAAMSGQAAVVKLLVDNGFNVEARNSQGETALMKAAAAGQPDVVKLLLDLKADFNAQGVHGDNALKKAIWKGHAEVVRALLDGGVDIDAMDDTAGRTPLMYAAQSGHLEVVKVLLARGANANAKDGSGRTALSHASGRNINEIEKVLKAHGATK